MTTNWRERFDEEFECKGCTSVANDSGCSCYTEIKSFIQQTLKEELKAVAGEVDKEKKTHLNIDVTGWPTEPFDWNSALDKVQAIINRKIENV